VTSWGGHDVAILAERTRETNTRTETADMVSGSELVIDDDTESRYLVHPFNAVNRTRQLSCRSAIKEAIQEEHRSFNEGRLDSLHNADSSSFWRMWRKRYCSKNVTATSVLNGKYRDSNILSEFTDFYKKNIAQRNSPCVHSKLSQDVKALLDVRLNDHTNDVPVVALGDIEQCIMNLKHNKAG